MVSMIFETKMNQVHPTWITTKQTTNETNIEDNDGLNNSDGKSLEQEWMDHKELADKRCKLFEDIINNRESENENKRYYSVMLSLIGGMLFSYVILCFLTLVPTAIWRLHRCMVVGTSIPRSSGC